MTAGDVVSVCPACRGTGLMLAPDADGESVSQQACVYCPAGDDPPALIGDIYNPAPF